MVRGRKKNYALIAIGVLLAATAVYIGAGKLLSRDAVDQYFEVEGRNFQRAVQSIDTYYSAFMEKQKPFLENANRRRTEYTLDIRPGTDASGTEVPDGSDTAGSTGLNNMGGSDNTGSSALTGQTGLAGLADLIRGSKLIIDTRSQPQPSSTLSDISLLEEKIPFLDARLFTDKDRLYLSVPAVFDGKYLSAGLDRLGKVYDRLSIPIKPARIINGPTLAKTLKFDKTTFAASVGKLAAILKKHIRPDSVRYGQNTAVEISGGSFKGREIIVTLNEEQATSLLHELAFAIAGDDALLQFTYGNAADLSALFNDAGLFRLYAYLRGGGTPEPDDSQKDPLEMLNISKDFEGFKQNLQKNAAALTIRNGLKMTLLVDKEGNILDRKLGFDLLNTGDNSISTLELETGSSNAVFEDPRNRFADILLTQYRNTAGDNATDKSGKTIELHIRPEFEKPTGTDSGGSLTASCLLAPQGGAPTGIELKLDIADKTEIATMKRNRIINYDIRIMAGDGEGTVTGKLSGLTWSDKDPDVENKTVTLDLNADIPFLGINKFSAVLGLAGEDSFGTGPFSLPAVQPDSVIDLNTAAPEDIERIGGQALAGILSVIAGK